MVLRFEENTDKLPENGEEAFVAFTKNLEGSIFYNHDNTNSFENLVNRCKDLISKHESHNLSGTIELTGPNLHLSRLYFVNINRLEKLFSSFELSQDKEAIIYSLNPQLYIK